jgi:hypothetical protein
MSTPRFAVAGNIYAIEPDHVEDSRAYKYARLADEACFAALDERGFPYKRVDPTKGIDAPIRLSGPVHGVAFHLTYRGPENTDDDKLSSSILDCRLGLAIDDLATVLAKHDIVKAEYLSMYRATGGFVKGVRHPAGRAIDLATVTKSDNTTFNISYDWQGRGVGAKTCGEGAAAPLKDTEGARLFRSIVCELADEQSFNLILSPHYDWGHHDHLHMEVRSDIRWYLIQ